MLFCHMLMFPYFIHIKSAGLYASSVAHTLLFGVISTRIVNSYNNKRNWHGIEVKLSKKTTVH